MPNTTSPAGFRLVPGIQVLQETFEKSAADSLARFLVRFPSHQWMAFSDYAFYDPNKRADVFVLSLFPFPEDFHGQSAHLQALSFKDIKSIKAVNPEFIAYLRSAPIANIAVLLEKERQLARDERGEMLEFFSSLSNMVHGWCKSQPEQAGKYALNLKDLKRIRRLVYERKANLRLLRDIILVASITGYVLFRVAQLTEVDTIGWFSDRDALLDYQRGKLNLQLIFQLLHTYYHVLCERASMPSLNNPILGVPENTGPVFYDAFLRVPDLIAGTLADLNLSDMSFTNQKFGPILSDLLASNDKNIFFAVRENPSNGSTEAVRLMLERGTDPLPRGGAI
jgi:hypothetical protein